MAAVQQSLQRCASAAGLAADPINHLAIADFIALLHRTQGREPAVRANGCSRPHHGALPQLAVGANDHITDGQLAVLPVLTADLNPALDHDVVSQPDPGQGAQKLGALGDVRARADMGSQLSQQPGMDAGRPQPGVHGLQDRPLLAFQPPDPPVHFAPSWVATAVHGCAGRHRIEYLYPQQVEKGSRQIGQVGEEGQRQQGPGVTGDKGILRVPQDN